MIRVTKCSLFLLHAGASPPKADMLDTGSVAVISASISFIVAISIGLAIGILTACLIMHVKSYRSRSIEEQTRLQQSTTALCEEMHQKQDIELETNLAYGPI